MTKMAACYPNYSLPIYQKFTGAASVIIEQRNISQQQRQIPQLLKKSHENVYQQLQQQEQSSYFSSTVEVTAAATAKNYIHTSTNYFVPLHVDCSVEYELPKQPKPPAGKRVEPLLMIHPCYFRKMESQSRSPFINNMPSSSRNGTTMFVGVALFSQGSNIASASTSTISLKGSSVQNHQNYNTKQNFSSRYYSISNTNHQQELQQMSTPQHHTIQHNLSLIPHHDHFLEGKVKFLEDSSIPIRRAAIAIVNRTNHHHIICSTQSKNKSFQSFQRDHVVQDSSSSKSSADLWDQLVAVKSSISDENPNKHSFASINSLCEAADCSIASCSTLGKRDAMISGNGEYLSNSALTSNNISVRIQMNKNNKSSSEKNYNSRTVPIRSSYGISTCLGNATKQPWNPKAHITSPLCMLDQIPIATVPSHFRAGPDTAPTKTRLKNKYRTVNDNNECINANNIISSIKKINLRSHRVLPYLTVTSAHSENALALSSKSAMEARGDFQVLPQLLAAKSAVAAVSTETSFQQPMHHISCYKL